VCVCVFWCFYFDLLNGFAVASVIVFFVFLGGFRLVYLCLVSGFVHVHVCPCVVLCFVNLR
jgi:hypothetical protein